MCEQRGWVHQEHHTRARQGGISITLWVSGRTISAADRCDTALPNILRPNDRLLATIRRWVVQSPPPPDYTTPTRSPTRQRRGSALGENRIFLFLILAGKDNWNWLFCGQLRVIRRAAFDEIGDSPLEHPRHGDVDGCRAGDGRHVSW